MPISASEDLENFLQQIKKNLSDYYQSRLSGMIEIVLEAENEWRGYRASRCQMQFLSAPPNSYFPRDKIFAKDIFLTNNYFNEIASYTPYEEYLIDLLHAISALSARFYAQGLQFRCAFTQVIDMTSETSDQQAVDYDLTSSSPLSQRFIPLKNRFNDVIISLSINQCQFSWINDWYARASLAIRTRSYDSDSLQAMKESFIDAINQANDAMFHEEYCYFVIRILAKTSHLALTPCDTLFLSELSSKRYPIFYSNPKSALKEREKELEDQLRKLTTLCQKEQDPRLEIILTQQAIRLMSEFMLVSKKNIQASIELFNQSILNIRQAELEKMTEAILDQEGILSDEKDDFLPFSSDMSPWTVPARPPSPFESLPLAEVGPVLEKQIRVNYSTN